MSRMTCRNGFVFVAAIGLGLTVTSARSGNLDSQAGPTNPASAMWTLESIYNVLDTRTTNVTRRTAGFADPTGGPTNGTMHTLNDIMALATNRAPVPKTGQTTSYATDDDGALKLGVAWPNPGFTIQADTNCVLDNLTGLIWARNANLWGKVTWGTAVTNCNNLDYGGQTDWRLPNVNELYSLLTQKYINPAICNTAGTGQCAANDPFTSVQSSSTVDYYWSSSHYLPNPPYFWCCHPHYGTVGYANSSSVTCYVWPVRGGR